MASSREGHPAFDPVHAAAADNEKEKKKSLAATHAALAAWGGPEVLKPLISAAVNHWQASVCCFGHGLMEYETVYQDYTSRMPPTLDIQPDLNTDEDRLHLTLPALPIRVVLATVLRQHLQWAIARRGVSETAKICEIAGPVFLRAQHAPPKDDSCAYAYRGHKPTLLDQGLLVRLPFRTERKDVHVRLWQPDAERYQVSGVTALSAVSPRKVVFNLTIEHAAVNPRPTLYLCLTFDLDYGQSGHSGALRSSTHAGHEVVARSLGVRTPRVLRRW